MATDENAGPRDLHVRTPLVYSEPLSARTGHAVYLKLESSQPSGSFKLRGVGRMCAAGPAGVGVVCSSGGNAGLAAAWAARALGVGCRVYVPTSTEAGVVSRLRGLGAEVSVVGAAWDEADAVARAQDGVYVHPFEGDALVAGHATLLREVHEDGVSPDLVLLSVGGGGLLRGVLASKRAGTRVLATQCMGADAFARSLALGSGETVTLPAITSKATSMGARTPSRAAVQDALASRAVDALVMHDSLAASAVWQLHRDHGVLVELACGAALAPCYYPQTLLAPFLPPGSARQTIVVVVCGGSKIDLDTVAQYRQAGTPTPDPNAEAGAGVGAFRVVRAP